MVGREDYQERREARIERLKAAAIRSANESQQAWKHSHDLAARVPFGQPVLVGHHSEGMARSVAKEIGRAAAKAVAYSKKTEYYTDRVEAAENNQAISSDDPNCLVRLVEKVQKLTAKMDFYKSVNAYYRKHGTCKGFDGLSESQAEKLDEASKNALNCGKPIAGFELTCLGANIRTAKKRIETLKAIEAMPAETIVYDGFCEIDINKSTNRVTIKFCKELTEEQLCRLRNNGFKWAYTEQKWQRLLTPGALMIAKRIVADWVAEQLGGKE